MTNQEFTEDIKARLKAIDQKRNGLDQLSKSDLEALRKQEDLLRSALKIMTYGTGPERRRFRRDYERRLTR